MNKLAALVIIVVACISGCRNAVRCREKESQFTLAAQPERTTELDSAKTCCSMPTDGEKDRPHLPPVLTESAAQQHPGEKDVADSPWSFVFSDEMSQCTMSSEHQAHFRFAGNDRPLFDNGWIGAKSVSVGISETPFNSPTAVNAFLSLPQGEHGDWLFDLRYSGGEKPPYLVPGIQYLWQPSERIRTNVSLIFPGMDDFAVDLSLGIRR